MENLLAHDLDFQCKCLLLLYNRQTLDEQQTEQTAHSNGQGLNRSDAPVLTPIAEALRHGNALSAADKEQLSKRMPKYANQLKYLVPDEDIE